MFRVSCADASVAVCCYPIQTSLRALQETFHRKVTGYMALLLLWQTIAQSLHAENHEVDEAGKVEDYIQG